MIVVVMSIAQRVGAQEPKLVADLALQSPGECTTAEQLVARIEQSVGRRAFVGPELAELRVGGVILRVREGWEARLELSTPRGSPLGERVLFETGQDCRVLDEPLALVIALIVDSPAVREAVVVAQAHESTLGFAFGLGTRGGVGNLPNLTLAFEIFAELRMQVLALRLSVGASLPSSASDTVGTVELQAIDATLWACPNVDAADWLRFAGCLGARGGAMRARGQGLDETQQNTRGLLDAVAMLELVAHAAWFEVGIAVGGGVALVRDRFFYTQGGARVVLHERSVGFGEARLWVGFAL